MDWTRREKRKIASNTASPNGEGLETDQRTRLKPRQSFTRQLLFKEWKSYANLRAFGTRKASIAAGLIWAALCAALIRRFLA